MRRFAFGLSGFAQNIVGTSLAVHLFMFYTDVAGLAPLWVSAGLVLATVWDAFSDLAMGFISDRTRTRLGRRRPYIVLGALPLGFAYYALLAPPEDLSGHRLGGYFVLALLSLFTAKTVVQVPALSLLPELAESYDERTLFAASREQLGNVGDLLGLLLPPLVLVLGGFGETPTRAEALQSFRVAAMVGGGLVAGASLITFIGTRERPAPVLPRKSSGPQLRQLLANRELRTLFVSAVLAALALAFVQALILYVLEHVMHERDPVVHMVAFSVNALAAFASYPIWTRFTQRFGKPAAFRLGLVASAAMFGSVFFVGPGHRASLMAVMVLSGIANVGFWLSLYAIAADITDLDELISGERREGLFAGLVALIRKCAIALSAAAVGLGLSVIGYSEQSVVDPELVSRLKLLFAIPPTLLVAAAFFLFRKFGLDRSKHAAVRAELAARRPSI